MVIAETLKDLNSKAPPISVPSQNQGRERFPFYFCLCRTRWETDRLARERIRVVQCTFNENRVTATAKNLADFPPRDANASLRWGIWTAESICDVYITHNIGAVGLVSAWVPKGRRLIQGDCEDTGLTALPFKVGLPISAIFHKSLL